MTSSSRPATGASAAFVGGATADFVFDAVQGGDARQRLAGDRRHAALGQFVKVSADMRLIRRST